MEAAPRLAMLSLDVKESRNYPDFRQVFRQFISSLGESGAAYDKELVELEGLRNSAVKAPRDISGCNVLKRYFCQLKMLYPRFPMKEGEAAAVEFSWQDNFTAKTVDSRDPKFEEANILYNIGALHSLLGAVDRRVDPETMKVTCTHFQCAAWAFEHLRDKYPRMPTFDLSFDVLSFYITLMLAQAQECILEKSILDNRKSSIISKVAAQVVEYYKECLKALDSETTTRMPGMDSFKDFIPRQLLELKVQYYQCITYYQLGCVAEESQKWGERIAYLDAAAKELASCSKLIKNCGDDDNCREAVKFIGDIVQQKLAAAKKDNDFIYHERIPDVNTLPPVKGVSLVKGIPLNETEYASQDIFVRLVPFSAHEKASLYSDKKDDLKRSITEKVSNKDVELMSIMSALRLEQLQIPVSFNTIPQNLLDIMASFRGEGDVSRHIARQAETLNDATEDVRRLDEDIGRLLEDLKKGSLDESQRSQLLQFESEHGRYSGALAAAVSSSDDLQHFMDSYSTVLDLLGGPVENIKASLPSVDMDKMTNEKDDVKELERLLGKVEEMKRQRHEFLSQLCESLQSDDITKKVLAVSDENMDTFFQKELEKHSSVMALLEQNINAQENIVAAVTAVVERLADLRAKLVTTSFKREEELKKYDAAYRSYQTFAEKVAEGLEFYRSFKDMLAKLKSKVEVLLQQTAPVGPKVTRPPVPVLPPAGAPVRNVTTVQGPTLRDYLNRTSQPNNEPGVPASHVVHSSYIPGEIPFTPASSASFNPSMSAKPTLRDYLEAKTGGHSVSVYPASNRDSGAYGQPMSHAIPESPMHHYQPGSHAYQGYSNQPMTYPERKPPAVPAVQPLRPPTVRLPPPPSATQPVLFSASSFPAQTGPHQAQQGHVRPSNQANTPGGPGHGNQNMNFSVVSGNSSWNQHPVQNQYPGRSSMHAHQNQYSGQPGQNQYFNHSGATLSYQNAYANQSVPYNAYSDHQSVNQYPQHQSAGYSVPQVSGAFDTASQHPGATYGLQQTPASFNAPSHTQPQQHWMPSQTPADAPKGIPGSSAASQAAFSGCSQQIPQLAANFQPAFHPSVTQTGIHNPSVPQPYSHIPQTSYIPGSLVQNQAGITNQGYSGPSVSTNTSSTASMPVMNQSQNSEQNQNSWTTATNAAFSTGQILQPQYPTATQQDNGRLVPPPQPPVPLRKQLKSPLDDIDISLPESSVMTPRRASFKSQQSADDLLTVLTSPAVQEDLPILKPEVLTVDDIKRLKEQQDHVPPRDPLTNPDVLEKIASELREFQKTAEEVINNPATLERIWKQLRDIQDRDSRKHPIGAARCYPGKNRDTRIMPYDFSRIILQETDDDYINASSIEEIDAHCPRMIATQTPMPNTVQDFWMMVLERGVEVVAAIMTEYEAKEFAYWPLQRQTVSNLGSITVTLQKEPADTAAHVIRMLTVTNQITKVSRNIVHVLFKSWPADGVPRVAFEFARFVQEVNGFQKSQRVSSKPLVVHCNLGVGPTGIFCAATAFSSAIIAGSGPLDITETICKLRNRRKYLVDHKDQLRFLYDLCITISRQILHRCGMLPDYAEPGLDTQQTPSPAKSRPPQSVTPLPDVLNDIRQELQRNSATPPLQPEKVVETVTIDIGNEKTTEKDEKVGLLDELPSRLTDLNLQLDTTASERKKRITKESFVNPSAGLMGKKSDAGDPFSGLDPFWSMKK